MILRLRAMFTSIVLLLVLVRGSVGDGTFETLPPGPTSTPAHTTNMTTKQTKIEGTASPIKCSRAGFYFDSTDNTCKSCGKNTYSPPGYDECFPCPEGTFSPVGSESEAACAAVGACEEGKFRCANGENCVDEWKQCDGKNDCKDASDESTTLCKGRKCPAGTETCADNVTCVSTRGWCDGRPVCPENADEDYEFCKGYQCAKHDWKCGEGTRCITRWVICDGKMDCTDGSDEDEGMCRNYVCPNAKERCLDGLQCVSRKRLCDGKFQCNDGSDELIRSDETCPSGYKEFSVDSKPSIRVLIEIWKSRCIPPRVWRRRRCRRPARRKPDVKITGETIVTTGTPLPATTDAPCPDGSFRTVDGGCEQCGENTYLELGDRHCTPCPEGKVSAAGSTSKVDCVWEPCTAGNYLTSEGCKECPANTFSGDGAKKCRSCPEGLVSPPGSISKKDCGLPEYPTCNCNTPECDYCRKMECTVQQDLVTSDTGIVVTSQVKWRTHNTIVFYDEDGQIISKLEWSRQHIVLTGCATCKTPQALKDATSKEEPTTWGFSLKEGLLKVIVDGEVLYERQLPEECANIYLNIKRFAFSDMTCENTFTYQAHEMELGEMMTPDCGGHCPTEE